MIDLDGLTKEEARGILIQKGVIAAWYLRPYQDALYSFIRQNKNPVIECSRRFGKTTTVYAFVNEELERHPGWITRWCFPQKDQASEIMNAIVDKVNIDLPRTKWMIFKTVGSFFHNSYGSRLYIRGVNEDRGESARGAAANIIVADEFGFWKEADYIAREVLRPQLDKQPGGWFIRASTPPRDLAHPFYEELDRARREGRAITRTIYDRDDLSQEEFDEIVKECRGTESPAFQREYLCKRVSDPEMLVIPEFRNVDFPEGNIVPNSYERPEYFTPYVGGDSGADDNTALLFAYYDFENAQLVFDDEWVDNNQTTSVIVSIGKLWEAVLWNGFDREEAREIRKKLLRPETRLAATEEIQEIYKKQKTRPKSRVYDAGKQIINDIYTDHSWPVQMPEKDGKLAAIHEFRNLVADKRILIKDRCQHLRRQLSEGLWRDDKHSDFQRNDTLGHLDAIAAALYLARSVNWNLNPRPPYAGLSRFTHHIPAVAPRGTTETELRSAFRVKGRRR